MKKRHGNELQSYITAIKVYCLLDREEEMRLATIYANVNKCWSEEERDKARKKLINHNLRLVVYIAKQYRHKTTLSLADLIQEGNCGLVRAVDLYDVSHNTAFSTYAGCLIRQAIYDAIVSKDKAIRIPDYVDDLSKKVNKFAAKHNMSREQAIQELLPIKKQEKVKLAALAGRCLNQNDNTERPRETGINGLMADPEKNDPLMLVITTEEGPNALLHLELMEISTDKAIRNEAYVLRRRYFGSDTACLSYKVISEEIKLSRERTRQLHDSGLIRLKKSIEGENV